MATKKQTENAAEVTVKTKRGKRPNIIVLEDTAEDLVRDQVGGFVSFLREKAIVGMAVGFVVATQVQVVVKQFISGFIDPAFKLSFGGEALNQRTFTLQFHGRSADFGWGAVAYVLMDFVFVLAIIYVIIKIFNLDKLDKPKK